MTVRTINIVLRILTFTIPLIIYFLTLAPAITYTDSGELAASLSKLAITHPTGYPLFTLIGHLFSMLYAGNEIYILNLMCALTSSLTVSLLYSIFLFVLKILDTNIKTATALFISFSASLSFAFSKTFWDSSNSLEVHSLHTLFLCILMYLLLKVYISKTVNARNEKYMILFAFILGLSFTHHLTTVFFIPAIVLLYYKLYGFSVSSRKRIFVLFPFFVLGISVYVYLPVRAGSAVINWIYPVNFTNIWHHITGKHFDVLMFKSFDDSIMQFKEFWIKLLLPEFYYIGLIIAVPGVLFLYKKDKIIFYFSILSFLVTLLLAVNYIIIDIESYYLLAYISIAVWLVSGFYYFVSLFRKHEIVLSILTIIIPALILFGNYSQVDESKNHIVDDYYHNFVSQLPQNSVVVIESMDVIMLASFYYQFVKSHRTDVVVFNDNVLSQSVWYCEFLKQHYPEFYNKCYKEFTEYQKLLEEYLNKNKEQSLVPSISKTYVELYKSIVSKNENLFFSQKYFQSFYNSQSYNYITQGKHPAPYGLFWKFVNDSNFVDDGKPVFSIRMNKPATLNKEDQNPFDLLILDVYYEAFVNRAAYLIKYDKLYDAEELLKKAFTIYPNNAPAFQVKKMLDDKKLK